MYSPTDKHIFAVAAALYSSSYDVDQLYDMTKIDRWFLYKIRNIVNTAMQLETYRDKVCVWEGGLACNCVINLFSHSTDLRDY